MNAPSAAALVELALRALGGLTAAQRDRLANAALALPAADTVGFEFRLDRTLAVQPTVDLQLGFTADELPAVAAWSAHRDESNPVPPTLLPLLAAAATPEEHLPVLGLEVDLARSRPALEQPATFVRLPLDGHDRRLELSQALTEALLPEGLANAVASLSRRVRQASGHELGFLGYFPARSRDVARVNVVSVGPHELDAVLRAARWPGAGSASSQVADRLAPVAALVDRVSVCFDITAAGPLATLGLEVFTHRGLPSETAWRPLLPHLVGRPASWSSTSLQDALGWPGGSTPLAEPWPDGLVCRGLVRPSPPLVLHRWVNHVKLGLDGTGVPTAPKVYLGARLAPVGTHAQAPRRPRPANSVPRTGAAAARAYYDANHETIVRHFGATYQAAILTGGDSTVARTQRHNREMGRLAALAPNEHVLDLGCGAAGPAMDIARAVPGLRITGVTVSERQAREARSNIDEAGLSDRLTVAVADFHALPFPDDRFDRIVSLEAACYANPLEGLLSECRRTLRPEGTLFLKEWLLRRAPESPAEEQARDAVAHLYGGYLLRTLPEVCSSLEATGFVATAVEDLSDVTEAAEFFQIALSEAPDDMDFAIPHAYRFDPILDAKYVAAITARTVT